MGRHNFQITEDGINFLLPLNGFDMKDLEVNVEEGALKVRAKKKEKGETVTTSMMKQTIALPENCSTEDMETAFMEDGMLAITIPRKAKAIEGATQQETH